MLEDKLSRQMRQLRQLKEVNKETQDQVPAVKTTLVELQIYLTLPAGETSVNHAD